MDALEDSQQALRYDGLYLKAVYRQLKACEYLVYSLADMWEQHLETVCLATIFLSPTFKPLNPCMMPCTNPFRQP